MEFHFEVSAKVETLHLDGTTRYVLQGRISFHVPGTETAGEPLNLALVFPEDAWNNVDVGETLTFATADFFQLDKDHPQTWYYSNSSKKAERKEIAG